MKNNSSTYKKVVTGILLLIFSSCQKELPKETPTVNASIVTNITSTSAQAGGEVTSDGGTQVTERGMCWSSTNQTPTVLDNNTTDGSGLGVFTSNITGLTGNTTYYIRAYAVNSVGISYYSQAPFKTLAVGAAITTTEFSSITSTSFNTGGNIGSDGGSPVTARGVCWSISQNPTLSDNKTSDGTGSGSFLSSITGLVPGTTYFVRAYATNILGTTYGNQLIAKTSPIPLSITTNAVTSVTSTTASGGGNVTYDGGNTIISKGVCWGTTTGPTTANNKTSDGTGTGSFTSAIDKLTAGTTYYIRAYATNSGGTVYGNQISITTPGWLVNQISWLNTLEANTITTPGNLLDNDPTTKGGLSMSYYSTLYTKEMYLNFGTPKTLSGFKFSFEFPNVLTGKCSTYPGPGDIAHTCLANLYYKNPNGQWVPAYVSTELSVSRADQGCPMKDSNSINFSGISAKEWKFEMVGRYWLGGGYQTTTYYQVYDIQFFGY